MTDQNPMDILIATDPDDFVRTDGGEARGLGDKQRATLRTLIEGIHRDIRGTINGKAEAEIEVKGTIVWSGKVEGKIMGLLSLGGGGEKSNTVRITVTTTLEPEGS